MNKRIKKKKAKRRAIENYWEHSVPYAFMQFQETAKQVGVEIKGLVISLSQFAEVCRRLKEREHERVHK